MIRLVKRQLIIPRGDTGSFAIPKLAQNNNGVAIFSILDPLTQTLIFQKEISGSNENLSIEFSHEETVNLPVGEFFWDIKYYINPVYADGKVVDGEEVDSYYAGFSLPICEIRQTGDSLLLAEDMPTSTLRADQINLITSALAEIAAARSEAVASKESANASAQSASDSASSASDSATAAANSESAAAAAQLAAEIAESHAQSSATYAAEKAAEVLANIPTKVSELENDSGYLNQETDPTVPAWAKAQNKPSYTAQEVGALPDNTFIPSAVSDLQNDTGFITSVALPTKVSDLTNDAGYLTEHQDISGKADSADLAAVATSGSYNDLSNKPFIPSAISDLTDDSGHYTKPAGGIPAADLAETYLTQHQDISGKANISDLAAVATSGSYNDLLNKPTNVSSFTNDAGYGTYTKPVGGIPASDLAETYLTEHQDISGKVDKITGKGLSTNDFTDTYKTKLDNALTEHQDISGKVNSADLAAVATSGSYNDLLNKPTNVSTFTNDAGYLTSFTETDPTVPSWAKAAQKPTYTASEVGAPTVAEMNSAIGTAIGNVHQFELSIQQSLPTQDIDTHTIYLIPKTGDTNDVYDEYVYINNAWEMVGNTQIDLSNYVQKTDFASSEVAGIIKTSPTYGLSVNSNTGLMSIIPATIGHIKEGTQPFEPIVVSSQHYSVFYGLAKAAGDTTQPQSNNTVGTYTNEAKSAIRTMIGAAASADIPSVPVQDVQVNGTSVLSNGIANVPIAGTSTLGTVKVDSAGTWGVNITNQGLLYLSMANSYMIKNPASIMSAQYTPISLFRQHESVFYGLAAAAGDTTQSASENAVGTYTDAAKEAISSMIGAENNIIANLRAEDIPNTTQAITFDQNGNISRITHTSGQNTIRTDVFTFGNNSITEVRTLSTGQSMTIMTNTSTLETTITYSAS